MTNPDDAQERQHLRELLDIHTRNARSLEKQIAQFGIEPPLKLLNSLDFERREASAIEQALHAIELRSTSADVLTRHDVQGPKRPAELAALRGRGNALHTNDQLPPRHRSGTTLRILLHSARDVSRRWWAAGGITFVLLVALSTFALLRPMPNTALVDQIRSTQPGTRSFAVQLADQHGPPRQFSASAGDIVALFVTNDTDQPQHFVLVDGAFDDAAQALGAGEHAVEHSALLAPGERTAFPLVVTSGRHYIFASAPPGVTIPSVWGSIEVQGDASGE